MREKQLSAVIALLAVSYANASGTVSVDMLSAGEGQLPPTPSILCVDVLVDVSDGDSWTAGGLHGETV
jgi:hypothetical protein